MRIRTVAVASLAIAASFGAVEAAAQANKKTLTVAMAAVDAGQLDPHLTATTPDKALLGWMFNGLVRFKPGSMNPETIESDLAQSWDRSADGKVWTFRLRQGVQCHHGYGELSSDDVVYSLNRAGTKATSAFSSDFAAFDKIEALDRHTVRITLKNTLPSLLGLLTPYHGGNIICKKAGEEMGPDFKKKPIGTGPFMFEEHRAQQSVTLVANKNYFRGAPKLERIVYRYIVSDASRDLAFTSGEVDMTYGKQDQTWAERMAKEKGSVVKVMEPAELSLFNLNVKAKPLDDIRVRKAIAHAIDRDGMVKFKGPAVARAPKSVVPIGYLGYSDDVPLLEHSVDKAKQLLAEAGYPNGLTIKIVHTTLPGMLTTMQAAQAQLKRANINLDIQIVEHATFHQQIRQNLSPIVHYAAGRFPVADVYLTQFFHGRSIVGTPTAVTNFSHCDMADREIDTARSEPDPEKAKQLWKVAQQKLMAEVCAVPVVELLQLWAMRDTLDLGYELIGSLTLGPVVNELTRFK